MKLNRGPLPAVILFFLSPAIAELLSGSSPPSEFFQPFGFAVMAALYGSGAILVRETIRRWHKGWLSILILGAAYGILEEGLMVKSFFDPNWVDLGVLGSYGRWAGVNWVWSVELTLFHAVVSIAIPILLVELIFPQRRSELWVGRRGIITLCVLIGVDAILGYLLTGYIPPLFPYILAVAAVAGLVWLAWRLPEHLFLPRVAHAPHPFWFWLIGFMATVAFFSIFWGLPNTVLPPWATILIGISLVAATGWLIMHMSGNGFSWTEMQQLMLAAGPLTLMALVAPLQELDVTRTDNPAGMAWVGLGILIFLVWLWWVVRRRAKLAS